MPVTVLCPLCESSVPVADNAGSAKCPKCGCICHVSMETRPHVPPPANLEATRSYPGRGVDTVPSSSGTQPVPQVPGYEVLGILGQGGMGTVYQARDLKLKRLVALKMIRVGTDAGAEARERFAREAEAAAALQHPNIVQVFEVGEHDGLPYFSLEYLSGGTLKSRLAGEPLPAAEAARLIEILARAVHSAHQHGIVHRDLKPANVLLAGDGKGPVDDWLPKITDFGLAKHLDSEIGQTRTGEVLGTPSYMAPEQASGNTRNIGPHTDVYALGAVFYEVLTGRPPVQAASFTEALELIRHHDPVPPRRLQAKLPRDLETICLKCLEKDARSRYASAEALANDLRRFLTNEPILARPSGVVARTLKWARRRPALAVGLATSFVAAILMIVMGFLWYQAELDSAETLAAQKSAEATREKGRAEKEKLLREEAQRAKEKASQSEAEAKKQKIVADEKTQEAQRQKTDADEKKKEAEEKKKEAEQQTRLAEARAEENRRAAFAIQLSRVAELLDREPSYALELLQDPRRCPPDLRDYTWNLLFRLCKRDFLTIETEPGVEIGTVAYSPDGKTLAAGCEDGAVWLWQMPTGKELGKLDGPRRSVEAISFFGKGKFLAVANFDKVVRLWDVEARKQIGILEGHAGPVWGLALSPDGKILASASGATVHLWDLEKRQEITTLKHEHPVFSVAFSPDGKTIAAGGGKMSGVLGNVDGRISLWNADTREITATLQGHYAEVRFLAFSTDGATLASADGTALYSNLYTIVGSAILWDVRTRKVRAELKTAHVNAMAFSPDHKILTTARGGTGPFMERGRGVNLWEVATGQVRSNLGGHLPERSVRAVSFSPQGHILAAATPRSITLWDLTDRAQGQRLHGHKGEVYSLAFSPDSKRLLAGTEEQWQPGKGPEKPAVTIRGFEPGPARAALWDLATGEFLEYLAGHKSRVSVVAYSPDGKHLVTTGGGGGLQDRGPGEAYLRDAATGKILFTLPGHQGAVFAGAFSADSKLLATGGLDGRLRIWNTLSGKELISKNVSAKDTFVTCAAFSADGRFLAVASGRPKNFGRLDGRDGGPGAVKLLTVPDLEPVAEVSCDQSVAWLAVSPDGKALVIVREKDPPVLWDVKDRKERGQLEGHRDPVTMATFSFDGKTLATVSKDGTVKLWDPITGLQRATLMPDAGMLSSLAFSPSHQALAVGSSTGETICWHATAPTLTGEIFVRKKAPAKEGFPAYLRKVQDGKLTVYRRLAPLKGEELTLPLVADCRVRKAIEDAAERRIIVGDELPGGFNHPAFQKIGERSLRIRVVTDTEEKQVQAVYLVSQSFQAVVKKIEPGKIIFAPSSAGKDRPAEQTLVLADRFKVYQQRIDFDAVTADRGGEVSPATRQKFLDNPGQMSVDLVTDAEGGRVNEIHLSFLFGAIFTPPKKPAVPPGPKESTVAFTVKDQLTENDGFDKTRPKCHHKVHTLKMEPGFLYNLSLYSSFDNYLRIESSTGERLAEDDDSAGNFNARIIFRARKAEEFRVIATTCDPGVKGPYTLVVRRITPLPADPGKAIFSHKDRLDAKDPGDAVRKGSPHKVHAVALKAGEAYLVDIESAQFNAYLRIEDSTGKQLAEDDNGSGTPNPRYLLRSERDGDYRIIVTAFEAGRTGEYSVTVRQLPPAK